MEKHFEELLNRAAPSNPPDIQLANEDLPIKCDEPTSEKDRKAIRQLKNGKASGPNNMPTEALKADQDAMVSML